MLWLHEISCLGIFYVFYFILTSIIHLVVASSIILAEVLF